MAVLGIDLGTSNSAAAVAVGGLSHMIQPVEGGTDEGMIFPSYVAFDINGTPACAGLLAKRQYHGAADLIVRHVKRLIGRSYDYITRHFQQAETQSARRRSLDEFKGRLARGSTGEILIRVGKTQVRQYAPHEVATMLLSKIREDAEMQLRQMHGATIDRTVITVPAGFDDAPLRATLWAGEEVFGRGNVQLIPEPLAAAIAGGTRKDAEMIMVVDMGAGTTDIVVGHVIRGSAGGYEWAPITQGCDDELGGWDMDYQILEQLMLEDRKAPYLRDLYPCLDQVNQGRLMEAIERAKIAVSTNGAGQVSTVLEVFTGGRQVRKPVIATLDAAQLGRVVAYREPRTFEDPGSVVGRCRTLVENTLLELADGNPARLREARASLDRVILVGGPMRMRCLYDMMSEVFADNPSVLERFDPLNTFPMECVARGAALYQGERVMLQVPHTLSLFSWSKGGAYTPVILRNTPFEGCAESTVELDVDEGANWLDIVTEKSSVTLPDFPVREHLVRTPKAGKLTVTLRWDTAGCRLALSGAGISHLEIPAISEQTTLRTNITRQFSNILLTIVNLRQHLQDPRTRGLIEELFWQRAKLSAPQDVQVFATLEPEIIQESWKINGRPVREVLRDEVNKLMTIPAPELARCESLDPQYAGNLLDSELKLILERGFSDGAREVAKARGVSENVFALARIIRAVLQEKTTVVDLQGVARSLLNIAMAAAVTSPLIAELQRMSGELARNPANRVMLANVAVRVSVLADVLYDQGFISRDGTQRIKSVVAKMQSE